MQDQKRNVYYRSTFSRGNYIKLWFLAIAQYFTSYSRTLIEVITRRNFGSRYFNLGSVITLAVILSMIPFYFEEREIFGNESLQIIAAHWAWYMYIGAMVYFGIMRWREMRQNPATFDFSKYSLYAGDVSSFHQASGVSIRTFEIFLEPGVFFIAGLLFSFIGQSLGLLLIVGSVLYSCSYQAAYMMGDENVQDLIDEIHFTNALERIIMDGDGPDQTGGVQIRADLPQDPGPKSDLLNKMRDRDGSGPAIAV
jgi:hypothetical protein